MQTWTRPLRYLLPLVGLWAIAGVAAAQPPDASQVDTSHWRCRFCPFPSGLTGDLWAGPGYVSQSSAKFGEYNDLNQDGLYLDAGGHLTWYGSNANRWDLDLRNPGLETRSLQLSGGRQGRYQVHLGYDGIVHHATDDAYTPFNGVGGTDLTLPAGWDHQGNTAAMSSLPGALQRIDLGTRRRRIDAGVDFDQSSSLSYSVNFQHEHKDGMQETGATFLTDAMLLPQPVDYDTNTVDAGIHYNLDAWQLGLAYRGSFFTDNNRRLTWANPYTPLLGNNGQGQMSLPPDNQFNQLTLSGGGDVGSRAYFTGNVSAGRMAQNASFLAASINPALSTVSLPRSSAEARVNSLVANARMIVRPPVDRLRVTVHYRLNRRDNRTPQDAFQQVITDTVTGATVVNQPLSYTRYKTGVEADYTTLSGKYLSGGVDYTRYLLYYGAFRPDTGDLSEWARLRGSVMENVELTLRLEHARRQGSGQAAQAVIGAPENPLLTWYDVADRTRNRAHAGVTVTPLTILSIDVSGELTRDSYGASIGRYQQSWYSYTVDVGVTPSKNLQVSGYFTREGYWTKQRNSQYLSTPDWTGKTDDTFNTIGVHLRMSGLPRDGHVGAGVTYAGSSGSTSVITGAPGTGFPDLYSHRLTLRADSDFRATKDWRVGLALEYERFHSRYWALDGVGVDTVPTLLSLGQGSPRYSVWVAALTAKYHF